MRYLRKEHIHTITLKDKFLLRGTSKHITIRYKQASLLDVMEFLDNTERSQQSILAWSKKFVLNHAVSKCTEKDAEYIIASGYFDTIYKTYFEGAFIEWTEKVDSKWYPQSSSLVSLSSHLSIDPDTLIQEYTPEMVAYYTEGIVWNSNEATKEWQRKNRAKEIEMRSQQSNTSREELQKAFDRLDAAKDG